MQNPPPPADEQIHEDPPLDLVDNNIQDDKLLPLLLANEPMEQNKQTLKEYALHNMNLV